MLCNFSVQMIKFLIFFLESYFCPQKVEKTTPKSCLLMAVGSFFLCSPDCPKQPRTSFPLYKFFYTTISAKISVFFKWLSKSIFWSILFLFSLKKSKHSFFLTTYLNTSDESCSGTISLLKSRQIFHTGLLWHSPVKIGSPWGRSPRACSTWNWQGNRWNWKMLKIS